MKISASARHRILHVEIVNLNNNLVRRTPISQTPSCAVTNLFALLHKALTRSFAHLCIAISCSHCDLLNQMKSCCWILTLAALNPVVAQFADLRSACDPAAGQYLDVSTLKCAACADDADGTGRNRFKVPNLAHVDSNGTALSCVCANSYKRVSEACSFTALRSGTCTGFVCTACTDASSPSTVAYTDGAECVVSLRSAFPCTRESVAGCE